MINYSIWCFSSFFHFLCPNVLDNKCLKHRSRVLFFARIKLVARVGVYACDCTHQMEKTEETALHARVSRFKLFCLYWNLWFLKIKSPSNQRLKVEVFCFLFCAAFIYLHFSFNCSVWQFIYIISKETKNWKIRYSLCSDTSDKF